MASTDAQRQAKRRSEIKRKEENFKKLAGDVYKTSILLNALSEEIDTVMKEKPSKEVEYIDRHLKKIMNREPFDLITLKILLEMSR